MPDFDYIEGSKVQALRDLRHGPDYVYRKGDIGEVCVSYDGDFKHYTIIYIKWPKYLHKFWWTNEKDIELVATPITQSLSERSKL